MILPPNCFKRKCKHLIGVKQIRGIEATERNICEAFKNRIPDEIAYGDNPHLKPLPDQGNDIIYEMIKET